MNVPPSRPAFSQKPANLTDPPRMVPSSVRLRVLFGGWAQIAWLILGFTMSFVWAFDVPSSLREWSAFRGSLEAVSGAVTSVEKTNVTVGGGKGRSGTPVYRYNYEFQVGGETFQGQSYNTGQSGRVSSAPRPGVTIEFPLGDPSRSRIQGMRSSMMGIGALFVGLFPLAAVVALGVAFWVGQRNIHLLQDGLLTSAKLVFKSVIHGRTSKGRQTTSYKLTFEFHDMQGTSRMFSVTVSNPKYIEDEEQEPVLYDPHDPTRPAVLMDMLPGRPRVAPDGTLQSTSPQWDLLVLLLPAAVILGHGWFFVTHVLG